MVDRGNVDKHRHRIGSLRVEEKQKWGRDTARERYGELRVPQEMNNPPHDCYPQFKQDQRLNKHYDHKNDWVRGAGGDATKRPGYVPGYRKK
jgi:hypothetical protein